MCILCKLMEIRLYYKYKGMSRDMCHINLVMAFYCTRYPKHVDSNDTCEFFIRRLEEEKPLIVDRMGGSFIGHNWL